MTQIITIFFIGMMILIGRAQNTFFNEIRANDDGTDDGEFVELIGPAGFDLSGWQLAHVNGNDGSIIFSFTFPAGTIIPDDGVTDINGQTIGFIVVKRTGHTVVNYDFEWGSTAMQNGPDGVMLSNEMGTRIQALTWNGLGNLTGGEPAWRNIGNDDNSDNSLSAPDSLEESYQKDWDYVLPTPGMLNSNQTATDISLPVQLTSFRAIATDRKVSLFWTTESELDNLGFIIERSQSEEKNYSQIATYESMPSLAGTGNSSSKRNYQFIDQSVFNGVTYWYRLIDVSAQGVKTIHPSVVARPQSPLELENPVKLEESNNLPSEYQLEQNFPNPFNPATKIKFFIPDDQSISQRINLSVFDLNGKLIRTLIDDEFRSGSFEVMWNGTNRFDNPVSGGVYYYILNTSKGQLARRMILLR